MSYSDSQAYNQHAEGYYPPQQVQGQQPPYPPQRSHDQQSQFSHSSGVPGPYQTSAAHETAAPCTHNHINSPYQNHNDQGENASYYNQECNSPGPGQSEDERGLGSTLTGGAAGGFAAHQMGGGKLATAAGAAAGAIGMNMATHQFEKYQRKQHQQQQQYQHQQQYQQQQQPAQTVVVVPGQTAIPNNGLDGGLGLGGGLLGGGLLGGGLGGGLGVGRVHRRLLRRRLA